MSAVGFVSFGYTQGVPTNTSSIHNMRGLPNPKSRRVYKHLTGEDPDLQWNILDTAHVQRAYTQFERWLNVHVARA